MSRETIAKVLKRLRIQSGLTADQVGELLGKSGKTVNAWENNRGQPDAEALMMLCDIYKVQNILEEFKDVPERKQILPSKKEECLILAYRAHPEMQDAVNRLLGIEKQPEKKLSPTVSHIKPAQKTYIVRTAGRGEGVKDVEMTEEEIEFYKNLPDVDETDL